jgi:GxxExxY protein
VPFDVVYKGNIVGTGRLDFLVADVLVVELKVVEKVLPVHLAQTLSYLKAYKRPLGLLLNFQAATLREGVHRVVFSP